MTIHELKTWSDFFGPLLRGEKSFEIRLDDRGFRVGDQLLLREWSRLREEYSGRQILVNVNYIIQGFPGLTDGWVAMSISPVPAETSTPLEDLFELAEEGINYTDDYFRKKYDMDKRLAELKSLLQPPTRK